MTREEKIQMIQDIKNGVPAKFAMNMKNFRILEKNEDEDFFYAEDGTIVTEDEVKKHLPKSMLCVNVSKQFRTVARDGRRIDVEISGENEDSS